MNIESLLMVSQILLKSKIYIIGTKKSKWIRKSWGTKVVDAVFVVNKIKKMNK